MVRYADDAEGTASALLDRLNQVEGIETATPDELRRELVELLTAYEQRADAITTRAIAHGTNHASRQQARRQLARAEGLELADAAVEKLTAALAEQLMISEHVDELFADEALTEQLVRSVVTPFVERVEALALGKMRSASTPHTPPPTARRNTLADAGFPFPLFDAPRTDACVDEAGPCKVCGVQVELRFEHACYACFRAGKVAHVMDTELGMVRPEDAARGETHGIPVADDDTLSGLNVTGETREGTERWVRLGFAVDDLVELTRTPTYSTWQGESWLFCCNRPMVFEGSVTEAALATHGEPAHVLAEMLGVPVADPVIERVFEDRASAYGFRCQVCGKRRAHWDRS